ncbi:hypothetical protein ACS0TY_024928 [Phlomoides rotata]
MPGSSPTGVLFQRQESNPRILAISIYEKLNLGVSLIKLASTGKEKRIILVDIDCTFALLVFILYVRPTAINPADPGIMSKFDPELMNEAREKHDLIFHGLSRKFDEEMMKDEDFKLLKINNTDKTPLDYHCNLGLDDLRRDADERLEQIETNGLSGAVHYIFANLMCFAVLELGIDCLIHRLLNLQENMSRNICKQTNLHRQHIIPIVEEIVIYRKGVFPIKRQEKSNLYFFLLFNWQLNVK